LCLSKEGRYNNIRSSGVLASRHVGPPALSSFRDHHCFYLKAGHTTQQGQTQLHTLVFYYMGLLLYGIAITWILE